MFTKVTKCCVLLAGIASCQKQDHFKDALDDIAKHFNGNSSEYDNVHYQKLVKCFNKHNHVSGANGDINMYDSQIAIWKGIADYWKSNSTNEDWKGKSDYWGKTSPGLYGEKLPFNEFYNRPNETIGRYGILTYEPCNYASNLAYYHSVTKICDYEDWSTTPEMQQNHMKAMSALAVGSAFMHQSYTYVGARFDNLMISLISYLGHQSMVQNLADKSPMLQELSNVTRSMNSSQLMNNITDTLGTQPVPIWGKVLDLGDYPKDYFSNFGAIVSNIVFVVFPSYAARPIIEVLSNVAPTKEAQIWITDEYMPLIMKATANNTTPIEARVEVLYKAVGVVIKIVYAFAFQEQFLNIPGFQTAPVIFVGGHLVPAINSMADYWSGFQQTDDNVNKSFNVYPGQPHCKVDQGHSIWHEESANGLLDLVYLCDYVNSLVIKYIQH